MSIDVQTTASPNLKIEVLINIGDVLETRVRGEGETFSSVLNAALSEVGRTSEGINMESLIAVKRDGTSMPVNGNDPVTEDVAQVIPDRQRDNG